MTSGRFGGIRVIFVKPEHNLRFLSLQSLPLCPSHPAPALYMLLLPFISKEL